MADCGLRRIGAPKGLVRIADCTLDPSQCGCRNFVNMIDIVWLRAPGREGTNLGCLSSILHHRVANVWMSGCKKPWKNPRHVPV
eukprot:8175581-Alexandrium_andersonii.AAC.1